MKLNIDELMRHAGLHINCSTSEQRTAACETFARVIVERCAEVAEEYPKYGEATAAEIRNLLEPMK